MIPYIMLLTIEQASKQSVAIDVLVASLTVLDSRKGRQLRLEPKHIHLLVVQDLVGLEEGLDLVDGRSGDVR